LFFYFDVYTLDDSPHTWYVWSFDEEIPAVAPGFLIPQCKFQITHHEVSVNIHWANGHTFPALDAVERKLSDGKGDLVTFFGCLIQLVDRK
jgi:hypothetical protein